VSNEDLTSFFAEVSGDINMDYTNLSIEGYACIQDFFLLRNLKSKSLIILGTETKDSV
jgi:hypothetical protein